MYVSPVRFNSKDLYVSPVRFNSKDLQARSQGAPMCAIDEGRKIPANWAKSSMALFVLGHESGQTTPPCPFPVKILTFLLFIFELLNNTTRLFFFLVFTRFFSLVLMFEVGCMVLFLFQF